MVGVCLELELDRLERNQTENSNKRIWKRERKLRSDLTRQPTNKCPSKRINGQFFGMPRGCSADKGRARMCARSTYTLWQRSCSRPQCPPICFRLFRCCWVSSFLALSLVDCCCCLEEAKEWPSPQTFPNIHANFHGTVYKTTWSTGINCYFKMEITK